MTTQTKEIRTRVTDQIKADFIKLAENHGLTESELLRLLITNALSNQDQQLTPKEKGVDIEITELKIRLPKFLIEQAKAKAKTQGMATTRWIKSLVQSNLIQPPVLIDSAIIALKETDRELAAVGNNLNQIARKINESAFNIDIVKIEKLDEVKQAVKTVRAAIDELIKVSRNGWSINHD
jgi:predicted DNA binding CopG/RHH family protein